MRQKSEPGENRPPQFERDESAYVIKLIDLGSSQYTLAAPHSLVVQQNEGEFRVTSLETRLSGQTPELADAIKSVRNQMIRTRNVMANPEVLIPEVRFLAEDWQAMIPLQLKKHRFYE